MKHACLFIAAATLAACTTASDAPDTDALAEVLADRRVGERTDRVCFPRQIDGFRDARRDTVVIRRGVSQDYLLVMDNCPQLRSAQSIGLQQDIGTTCLRPGKRLIVSESAFSARAPGQVGPTTCTVDAIYRWNERDLNLDAEL